MAICSDIYSSVYWQVFRSGSEQHFMPLFLLPNLSCAKQGSSSSVHRVKKKNIVAALSHGPTWFSQAEHGMHLVLKYGEGDHAAPEVQRMLQCHDSTPKGSVALFSFLQSWDAQHSIN